MRGRTSCSLVTGAVITTAILLGLSKVVAAPENAEGLGIGANYVGQLGVPVYPKLSIPAEVVSFSAGHWTTLFIKVDGSLWGMGDNGYGKLAGGGISKIADGVKSASAGPNDSLFLKTDGTLWGQGHNGNGQLGLGHKNVVFTATMIAEDVASMSCSHHSLFVKTDGSLWGMGANGSGQLGDGTITDRLEPIRIAEEVSQAVAGPSGTLFVKKDGTLWGMGYNAYGELGIQPDGSSILKVPVVIASGVAQVAADGNRSMFLKTDGTLWGIGHNDGGSLGVDNSASPWQPMQVASEIASVSCGRFHTLFVKTDGSLWAMGSNVHRQLGDGTNIDQAAPVQVVAEGVVTAGAATHSGMYLKNDGSLWGMGWSWARQLGYQDDLDLIRPTIVPEMDDLKLVSAGAYHTLWLKKDGTLLASGYGRGIASGNQPWLAPKVLATGVVHADAGDNRTGYVTKDGTLWEVAGDDTGFEQPSLPPVKIGTDVRRVCMGSHTLFLKEDGTLWGIGANWVGQLGRDPEEFRSLDQPSMISTDVVDFATAYGNTFYIKTDGSAWGLGNNQFKQLADTEQQGYSSPVSIGTDVKSVGTNGSSLLLVKMDGTLLGRGWGENGELGLGPGLTTVYPARQIATEVNLVEMGERNSYFIKEDGSLWGMGENANGMLGDGSTQARYLPVRIASGVTQVSTESQHTVFIRDRRETPEGKLKRWMAEGGIVADEKRGALDIPFGDGTPNLLKYAFNMRNDAPDQRRLQQGDGTAGLPYSGLSEGEFGPVFRIEYLRRKGVGLVYRPEISYDLVNFYSFNPEGGEVIPFPFDPEWERVRFDIPYYQEWDVRAFGRVTVTLPDY